MALGDQLQPCETVDAHGQRVQAMFSDIAPGYDLANRLMSMGTDARWRRRAIHDLLPGQAPPAPEILDLCAGTMDSTLEIHRRYPDAIIRAGDFSAGMLEAGRERLRGPAGDKITAQVMDAHQLPLEDASLDAVFCAFGVRNLSELERATAEQLRCLRPGGTLTVLDFFRPTHPITRIFHAVYNRTLLPLIGWACTGNLGAYLYLPRSIDAFSTSSAYVSVLRHCGFDDIHVTPLTFGIASIVRATRPGELAP